MTAKLTRLTHKIAIKLHLVVQGLPFAVLAPGGKSGNVWIHHPRMMAYFTVISSKAKNTGNMAVYGQGADLPFRRYRVRDRQNPVKIIHMTFPYVW